MRSSSIIFHCSRISARHAHSSNMVASTSPRPSHPICCKAWVLDTFSIWNLGPVFRCGMYSSIHLASLPSSFHLRTLVLASRNRRYIPSHSIFPSTTPPPSPTAPLQSSFFSHPHPRTTNTTIPTPPQVSHMHPTTRSRSLILSPQPAPALG